MSSASNNPVTKTRFHRGYQRLLDGELVIRISTSLVGLRQAKNSVLVLGLYRGVGEAKEEENEMHEQWPPRAGTGRPLYGPAD